MRYVSDYLVEEVLNRQEETMQQFLLRTSLLDRFNAALCAELTGLTTAESQRMLRNLETNHLFITAIDPGRMWFRYNRLFADLLRSQLEELDRERYNGQLTSELHRRAAFWWQANGFADLAVRHWLAAGAHEQATEGIEVQAEALWARGEQASLLRWLEALPGVVIDHRPRLAVFHGLLLLLGGKVQLAAARLEAARRAMETAGPDRDLLMGMLSCVEAYLYLFRGEMQRAAGLAWQALECLPSDSTHWRTFTGIALGDTLAFQGDTKTAGRAYLEAFSAGRASGNAFLTLTAGQKYVSHLRRQGRLREALENCQQQLRWVEEHGLGHSVRAGGLYALLANLLCERNQLDQAESYARMALESGENGEHTPLAGYSYLVWLHLRFARGDQAGVQFALERLDELTAITGTPVWIANGLAAWKANLWTERGSLQAAAELLEARGIQLEGPIEYLREAEYLSLARLLFARGETSTAVGLLDRVQRGAQSAGRLGGQIMALVIRALGIAGQAKAAPGASVIALDLLTEALELAFTEGFTRVFLDEGSRMAALLSALVKRGRGGPAVDYANRLLAAFPEGVQPDKKIRTAPEAQSAALVEPLSQRELDLLKLVAEGLSNEAITERLYLALPTVKWHLSNIYGKLGVKSRTQAVATARRLGLI